MCGAAKMPHIFYNIGNIECVAFPMFQHSLCSFRLAALPAVRFVSESPTALRTKRQQSLPIKVSAKRE